MPAETAHGVALTALKYAPASLLGGRGDDQHLKTEVWGLTFGNPIGLAAGFDKHAEVAASLFGLGFGFVELGGVTLHPQPGNPKPRLFRLAEDRAVINRMGLNSVGADAFVQALSRQRDVGLAGPVSVNLGLNKNSDDPVADYAALAGKLAPLADILTINVSSPNTPGLRALQNPDKLAGILNGVRDASLQAVNTRKPVVLIKIAPDLEDQDVDDLCDFAAHEAVAGLVVSNTTTARPPSLVSPHKAESGGLSGAPLLEPSTALLRRIYARTGGRIPLIGVGGIASGDDVLAKVKAGAVLIQLYSALVFQGPSLIQRIKDELRAGLTAAGFTSVSEAVGADHRAGEAK